MSHLQTRRLVLSLALAVLWPATAFAQTPGALPPRAAPPQVQIKVEFATVSAADLDKSGVTFDRVPLAQPAANSAQMGAFLQYAVGESAIRLLRMLSHTRGKVVQAPLVTTSDNIGATIQTTQTGLTITPRINIDASITLHIAPLAANANGGDSAAKPLGTTLRTIRSGNVIAVAGLPFGPDMPSSDRKLLIFVTPTIVGTDAQKADTNMTHTSEKTVSLDVTAGDLYAVIAMLERQAGIEASVQSGDKPYKPVSVHLDGVSLSKALRTIAWSAGAKVTKNEDGVYVFSPSPGSAQPPTPQAPANANSQSVIVSPDGSTVTVTP